MVRRAEYERFEPVERVIDVCGTAYRFWCPPDVDALIDEEAFARDERIPYWANVWESAIVLAEELSALEGKGRRFLELGCGLGLPAVVAARRGFVAIASDYEEAALEGVCYNAAVNAAQSLTVRLLDWRRMPDDLGRFDLVAAADVLYEKHHAVALADVVATLDLWRLPENRDHANKEYIAKLFAEFDAYTTAKAKIVFKNQKKRPFRKEI